MARRPPALYRVSRLIRRLGLVALVLIIAFVATAAYSATEVRPHLGNGFGTPSTSSGNNTVEFGQSINVTNPGFYSLTALSVALEARDGAGALLARGGSPVETVGPGGTVVLPLSIWVPLSTRASFLVTHDAQLPVETWANATYASLFSLRINSSFNLSWGAPFFGFNATPSSVTPQPNGTALVAVMVAWQDHAGFDDVGTFTYDVRSAGGSSCASGSEPVDVASQSSYQNTLQFWLPASCNPSGGEVTSSFSGAGLSVNLPPEAIP